MKINPQPVTIFWFRRDLRLEDNAGLYQALYSGCPVLPLFIFDRSILEILPEKKDIRLKFIHEQLQQIQNKLASLQTSLLCETGYPVEIWKNLLNRYPIQSVYANHDYEPYGVWRDQQISVLLKNRGIPFYTFKDQVIFEKGDILKENGQPYTVFTPYKHRWLDQLNDIHLAEFPTSKYFVNFHKLPLQSLPSLHELGFQDIDFTFPSNLIRGSVIKNYHKTRDFPAIEDGTTRLGIHLRFGTLSIRQLVKISRELNPTYLSELIWREFFMMILHHFPRVTEGPFKEIYHHIRWINNPDQFQRWCEGDTGYPLVDAGMRELNRTGHMHNRVRMITASFLAKHLLVDWRWGENYFATKLLDFELSSNNGNWQWAAGCGCDAAPYFRVFNPTIQVEKFDPKHIYIKKWVPEYQHQSYPKPLVDHAFARERALAAYKQAVKKA